MTELRLVYEGSAGAWASGAARLYDRLAERIVALAAGDVGGLLVLDVGAGTGALCRALRGGGASVVALDSSADMLAHAGDAALLRTTGDMLALPFVDGSFDAAMSAFAVSHVAAPGRALAEMQRVVRPGGLVVAAVFGATPAAPSKDLVDEVAARFGHRRPDWYDTLKHTTEPLTNRPGLFRACAEAAGLRSVNVLDVVIESGLDTPEAVVGYRLGMAHLAPFVASLDGERRAALVHEAVAAVAAGGQPLRPRVLILSSRLPA